MEKGVTTRGGTLSLATGGRPITTTLGKVDVPPPFWSNDVLGRLQQKTGLSDNKMKQDANCIRRVAGRGSIVKLDESMRERNRIFEPLMSTDLVAQTIYVHDDNGGEKKKKLTTKEVSLDVKEVFRLLQIYVVRQL